MTRKTYYFGNIEKIIEDTQWEYQNMARLETLFYNWLIMRQYLYRVEYRGD